MQTLRTFRKHWWAVPVGAVLIFFTLNIARTVRSPSPALARAEDREKARRGVSPTKGEDRRWQRSPAAGRVVGDGVVEPRGEVIRVAGAAPGRIAAVLVKVGDQVVAGQVIARLDAAAERADMASAAAAVQLARSKMSRVRRGSRGEDKAAARARVARAQAQSALSRGVYQRLLKVHRSAEGAVALDQLDRARRAAEADRQAALQAAAERDRVINGARVEDRRAELARLKSARARATRARVHLARRQILAPSAGEVLRVNHRAGEYYLPGEGGPLIELGDTRRLHVRMELNERDLGRIEVGAGASVEAPAYPGRRFTAKVQRLGRTMGRKKILTGEPDERRDDNVLEVLLELQADAPLVVGQRVVAYVKPRT